MAQCPKCNGTGRVVSHLNPYDVNKVGAGMGKHRCDRCNGTGIQGASDAGGRQQPGDGLMAIVSGFFLHPVYSLVGFYLISLVFLGVIVEKNADLLANLLGLDIKEPSTTTGLYIFVFGLPLIPVVFLRKIIPIVMRWIFYIVIGGITLAFIGGVIWGVIERTASN